MDNASGPAPPKPKKNATTPYWIAIVLMLGGATLIAALVNPAPPATPSQSSSASGSGTTPSSDWIFYTSLQPAIGGSGVTETIAKAMDQVACAGYQTHASEMAGATYRLTTLAALTASATNSGSGSQTSQAG
jgi:hypothetical protein